MVAIWLPLMTNGAPPLPLMVPVKFCSVTSQEMSARRRNRTTSAPPPMLIAPTMREPGSNVSVSAPPPNWIAVPPVPMMLPALTTLEAALLWMPMVPAMNA